MVEAYLTSIKALGKKTIDFLNQEPEEEAFNVCSLTHGTNGFLNDLNLLTPQVIIERLRRRPLDVVVLVNHVDLASRRDILPWTERYKVVKTNLKTSEVPGWREQLLHLGKKSLKLEEDKLATKY